MNERTVLLVEDNPADVELMMSAFEELDFPYGVAVARDGGEALDYLFGTGKFNGRNKKTSPLLVILDLKLSKMGGLEVLKQMRSDSTLKHVVVVAMTSSAEERDQFGAQLLGANVCFQKPDGFDEFLGIVKKVKELLDAFPELVADAEAIPAIKRGLKKPTQESWSG